MKFFEQKEPFVLIKADDSSNAVDVFAREISEDILEYPEDFKLVEVSSEHAWSMYSNSTDEDGNKFSTAESKEIFINGNNELLCCSKRVT